MTVLVLTRAMMDATADLVITELSKRGVPVVRLDPADFPQHLAISSRIGPGAQSWEGLWRGRYRDLRLGDVTAVYYRRPGPFRLHDGLSPEDARWAREEALAGFGGVLSALPCIWVNHPYRNAVADIAPYALATAARCGLHVPRTLITNDPQAAAEFVSALPGGAAAYKPLAAAGPIGPDGQQSAVWTSRVTVDGLTDAVALTAHLFQEWIDKQHEVRVTAVGNRLFAAEIHAGSPASRIDFRRDYDSLTYRPCEVPDTIAVGVRSLMRALSLRYVALDLLVGHDDTWYLVDVNPGGQFGFIPDLRDPITHALADLLGGTRR